MRLPEVDSKALANEHRQDKGEYKYRQRNWQNSDEDWGRPGGSRRARERVTGSAGPLGDPARSFANDTGHSKDGINGGRGYRGKWDAEAPYRQRGAVEGHRGGRTSRDDAGELKKSWKRHKALRASRNAKSPQASARSGASAGKKGVNGLWGADSQGGSTRALVTPYQRHRGDGRARPSAPARREVEYSMGGGAYKMRQDWRYMDGEDNLAGDDRSYRRHAGPSVQGSARHQFDDHHVQQRQDRKVHRPVEASGMAKQGDANRRPYSRLPDSGLIPGLDSRSAQDTSPPDRGSQYRRGEMQLSGPVSSTYAHGAGVMAGQASYGLRPPIADQHSYGHVEGRRGPMGYQLGGGNGASLHGHLEGARNHQTRELSRGMSAGNGMESAPHLRAPVFVSGPSLDALQAQQRFITEWFGTHTNQGALALVNAGMRPEDVDFRNRQRLAKAWTYGWQTTYLAGDRLGSGSFGIVHAARRLASLRMEPREDGSQVLTPMHEAADHELAIKLISLGPQNGPISLSCYENLKREISCLRAVGGHANIVRLVDAFVTAPAQGQHWPQQLCLVMERGRMDLIAYTNKYYLTEAHVRSITAQAGSGLAWMHGKGYSHFDVKPDNILVMEDGRVALGDMGFARHSSDPKPAVGFGTLQYSAPEVLMGLPADHKADVWAFGCVVFMLLTHKKPFAPDVATGDSAWDLLYAQMKAVGMSNPFYWPPATAVQDDPRCLSPKYDSGDGFHRRAWLQQHWNMHDERLHQLFRLTWAFAPNPRGTIEDVLRASWFRELDHATGLPTERLAAEIVNPSVLPEPALRAPPTPHPAPMAPLWSLFDSDDSTYHGAIGMQAAGAADQALVAAFLAGGGGAGDLHAPHLDDIELTERLSDAESPQPGFGSGADAGTGAAASVAASIAQKEEVADTRTPSFSASESVAGESEASDTQQSEGLDQELAKAFARGGGDVVHLRPSLTHSYAGGGEGGPDVLLGHQALRPPLASDGDTRVPAARRRESPQIDEIMAQLSGYLDNPQLTASQQAQLSAPQQGLEMLSPISSLTDTASYASIRSHPLSVEGDGYLRSFCGAFCSDEPVQRPGNPLAAGLGAMTTNAEDMGQELTEQALHELGLYFDGGWPSAQDYAARQHNTPSVGSPITPGCNPVDGRLPTMGHEGLVQEDINAQVETTTGAGLVSASVPPAPAASEDQRPPGPSTMRSTTDGSPDVATEAATQRARKVVIKGRADDMLKEPVLAPGKAQDPTACDKGGETSGSKKKRTWESRFRRGGPHEDEDDVSPPVEGGAYKRVYRAMTGSEPMCPSTTVATAGGGDVAQSGGVIPSVLSIESSAGRGSTSKGGGLNDMAAQKNPPPRAVGKKRGRADDTLEAGQVQAAAAPKLETAVKMSIDAELEEGVDGPRYAKRAKSLGADGGILMA